MTMDFKLKIDGIKADMTFEKADSIINNIWLSLNVERGSFFADPEFGLRKLKRAKNTEETERLAREYIKEALQWIIDIGRVKEIDVVTQRDTTRDLYRLNVWITAIQADGRKIEFETFLEVV